MNPSDSRVTRLVNHIQNRDISYSAWREYLKVHQWPSGWENVTTTQINEALEWVQRFKKDELLMELRCVLRVEEPPF